MEALDEPIEAEEAASPGPDLAPGAREPSATGRLGRAGLGRRGVAFLVDLLLVWVLLRIGDLLTGMLARHDLVARAFDLTCFLVVPGAYFVLGHGTRGQTPGKWLVGARVVTVEGGAVGYPRALARYAAWVLSTVLFLAGHLLAAWRRDRRALHDLVAGTRVVQAR